MNKYAILSSDRLLVENVALSDTALSPLWVDLQGKMAGPGWNYDGVTFTPPPPKTQAEIDAELLTEAGTTLTANKTIRLLFNVLYDLESRARVLEAKPKITKAKYRTALVNVYKTL